MEVSQQFDRLLQPDSIGTMSLKNRMIMAPLVTNYASENGGVTQRVIDYYQARAKGGIGLIIVEAACVDSSGGKTFPRQLLVDDDRLVVELEKLVGAIHQHGAKAALQIHHGGRVASSRYTGNEPVAPSPIPSRTGETPRQLTGEEIEDLIVRFIQAGVRAKKAGFDGVEVHGTHGYLISQFLSAASNKRDDQYGGSVEKRARFLLEVLRGIRQEIGREYPVWCRLSGVEEGVENGITIEEAIQVARMAEDAGSDAVHVSGILSSPGEPGALLPLAEKIRKAVSSPVIAVMKIDPTLGESALQAGQADFIAFGRTLFTDPNLPNKVFSGRIDEIEPCIYCNACTKGLHNPDGVDCPVNPMLGREREYLNRQQNGED